MLLRERGHARSLSKNLLSMYRWFETKEEITLEDDNWDL